MDRDTWMWLRAFRPAALLSGTAIAVSIPLWQLQDIPQVVPLFDMVRWVPMAMLGIAMVLVTTACYRVWRWAYREGPSCTACGGPLGHERDGWESRGGAYRQCYACGKAINHRHYT